MSDSDEQPQTTARSPLSGCAILIIALVVMVFFVCSMAFTLFRQARNIETFTAEQPDGLEVVSIEGREAEINALSERIERFRQGLSGDEVTRLELSPAEINLAIAAYEPFSELRETFLIESIGEEGMRIRISYPINKGPKSVGEFFSLLYGLLTNREENEADRYRYLNAVLVTQPLVSGGQVIPRIEDIEVDGAEVPEGFVQQMSQYRPAERYIEHEVLGPVMAQLTAAEIEGDKLVLVRDPAVDPTKEISDEEVQQGVSRFFVFFGIAASLFLVFAGIMIFIGLRAQARRGDA
ncbi:MAG: hypothetical protein R3242_08760 [Akkermansiaceae bacterium]|nr:hypothetical protein [Akkermansiaceae bacterium]